MYILVRADIVSNAQINLAFSRFFLLHKIKKLNSQPRQKQHLSTKPSWKFNFYYYILKCTLSFFDYYYWRNTNNHKHSTQNNANNPSHSRINCYITRIIDINIKINSNKFILLTFPFLYKINIKKFKQVKFLQPQ